MSSSYLTHCRLCAELKCDEKLVNLDNDAGKCQEMIIKLSYLNAFYVDLSHDTIPKAICLICCEDLEKAYDFLFKVHEAQAIIKSIVLSKQEIASDTSCDERDFRPSPEPEVKRSEEIQPSDIKDVARKENPSQSVTIKNEPKEEHNVAKEENLTKSVTIKNEPEVTRSDKKIGQSLNVQEILDAAIFDNSLEANPVNMEWYGKELSGNKKSWKDYTWLCSHCKMEFPDLYVLRLHTKQAHHKCVGFACIDCFIKPNNFQQFVDHVRRHRKYLRYCCPYCDSINENSSATKKHLSEHFKNSECSCELCGEIFADKDSLENHTLEYPNINTTKRPRRKRGEPITTEDLTCKQCNKVYKNLNSLRDHSKLHTSDRKRNYTCDRCGKTFYQKGTLMSHMMVHEKIKPHVCKICNKSFLFPNMLRRHVEMHTGVKPFSCEQCGRCFRLLYQLKAHKIIHTDSLPYSCQYCNKSFRFKQIMKNHELQHTGAKPYMCQVCSMEFTNWSNYNKHMKRRHGTDTSKKKITPDGVIPVDPETGQLMHMKDSVETKEWRSKIMIPCKRGKKKIIKESKS